MRSPVVAHIAEQVVAAKVRHLDETGFRIGGKTRWLHSASTAVYTLYRIGETRGDVPRTMADGVIVHDHFKPYYTLRGPLHALCNPSSGLPAATPPEPSPASPTTCANSRRSSRSRRSRGPA